MPKAFWGRQAVVGVLLFKVCGYVRFKDEEGVGGVITSHICKLEEWNGSVDMVEDMCKYFGGDFKERN